MTAKDLLSDFLVYYKLRCPYVNVANIKLYVKLETSHPLDPPFGEIIDVADESCDHITFKVRRLPVPYDYR